MREVWFMRRGEALVSTDEDSARIIARMGDDECKAFRPVGVRDPVSHRRYWVLMTDTAKNVKQIEIDRVGGKPVHMRIWSKEDAHTAMKLCTGLYDTLPVGGTDYAIRVPKSTDFEKMTPEEWAAYWPQVMEVLIEKVAPDIEVPEARDEMMRSIERWASEAA